MTIKTLAAALAFSIALAVGGFARANVVYNVSLNTIAISGTAGVYGLAFSLTDGSGLNDGKLLLAIFLPIEIAASLANQGLTRVQWAHNLLLSAYCVLKGETPWN